MTQQQGSNFKAGNALLAKKGSIYAIQNPFQVESKPFETNCRALAGRK